MHRIINGYRVKVTCEHGRVSMNAEDYNRAMSSTASPAAEGIGWKVFSTR